MWRAVRGVVAALLTLEVLLRMIATPQQSPAPGAVIKQFREGLALSHFAVDGARLTANPAFAGAPVALILGDSHVEAVQVSDVETMGSVLEQTARRAGQPLNVRQYGSSGAAIAVYLAEATSLTTAWHPRHIFVIVGPEDLRDDVLASERIWGLRIRSDDSVELIDRRVKPPTASGARLWLRQRGLTPSAVLGSIRSHSVLASLMFMRNAMIREAGRNQPDPSAADTSERAVAAPSSGDRLPRIMPRALRQAYGSALAIVYVPVITAVSPATADPEETALLRACDAERVKCLSVRSAMLADRDKERRLSRGFWNSVPGEGHLNRVGHRLVAEALWASLSLEQHD